MMVDLCVITVELLILFISNTKPQCPALLGHQLTFLTQKRLYFKVVSFVSAVADPRKFSSIYFLGNPDLSDYVALQEQRGLTRRLLMTRELLAGMSQERNC